MLVVAVTGRATGGEGSNQAEEGGLSGLVVPEPEPADRYRAAKRAATLMVAEAKTQVWEEFRETMDKNFWLASRFF